MSGEFANPDRSVGGVPSVALNQVRSFVGTITKHDVTTYDPPIRALYIGGAGTLTLVLADDDESVAANRAQITVAAGEWVTALAVRQVRSTGTSATGILGFR